MKKNKIILIIILLLLVFLVGLLFYFPENTEEIVLKNDEFVFEYGEDISADVSYYLKDADSTKNIKDYKLSSGDLLINDNKFVNNELKILEPGEYNIKIMYKDSIKIFKLKVVDTISPEFTKFEDVIEVEQNTEKIDFSLFFTVSDLSYVITKIEGNYDLSKAGEYKISVVATDLSGNSVKKDSLIKVIKKDEPKVENSIDNNKTTGVSQQETNQSSPDKNSSNNNLPPSQTETSVSVSPKYRKDISDSYVTRVNAYRKEKGLSELPITTETQTEADRRSKELCTYYSHDGVGYGFGEVIGYASAEVDFIALWQDSPTHNATMLREQNTAIAASVYECNGYLYAVISFRMDY